jgi:hypothetical protein
MDVAQPAPDLRRIAQRLVKILQMKDGRALVCHDKIQRRARRFGFDIGVAAAPQPFRGAPGPDGRGEVGSHFAQYLRHALLFGGVNIGKRPAGFENLPNCARRAA